MKILFYASVLITINFQHGFANNCARKKYDTGIVCVCNATFCDTLPQIKTLNHGTYQLFTSNKQGLRFEVTNGSFSNSLLVSINFRTITLNRDKKHQTILGYGGAFTDSAGINIAALSADAQKNLLNSYFSENGSEYSLCRVPICGTDFSTRGYSCADEGNGTLDKFSLQKEDYDYKIPYIRKAYELSKGKLTLLASAWSSPPWSKTGGNYSGSFLKEQYYQLWADYFIKFFEGYKENNITFWGVTTQNEPATGLLRAPINSIAWLPSQLKKWMKENFGPTIKNSAFSDIKILIHDDQSPFLIVVPEYFHDSEVLQYVDGVAVHWYLDSVAANELYKLAQTSKKDTFILMTEACNGYLSMLGLESAVSLGSWERGVKYIQSVIERSKNNYSGWIDWNMVLDLNGGPTWINNFVDSPIIVNATGDEFYKQPMYYALAHVSKYVPAGSVRIDVSPSAISAVEGIETVGFLRPDKSVALIIYNSAHSDRDLVVKDDYIGHTTISVAAESISTLVYS